MNFRTNLSAMLVVATCFIPELSAAEPTALRRFDFSEPQMGTTMRIVFYAADAGTANRAARAAFDRVAELNRILTDYEASSELSRLSATAPSAMGVETVGVAVSKDLWNVLSQSQHWATESGGAFDVTVGPLTRLWRRARRQQELPAVDDLAAARKAVGFRFMKLDAERRTVQLTQPGMRLDVGGIGKGFAADEALAVLRKAGLTRSMVALSGDMAIGDAPPDQKGWRIGIGDLDSKAKPDAKPVTDKPESSTRPMLLANCGVSTSGDKFQFVVIGGRRYSHILDPRIGEPLSRPSSATTVAPTATTADACATAISVLGPTAGLEFAKKVKGLEVQIATAREDKSETVDTVRSDGFERLIQKH